eukprot:6212562-Pleurochrysis_carterae.AAC.1
MSTSAELSAAQFRQRLEELLAKARKEIEDAKALANESRQRKLHGEREGLQQKQREKRGDMKQQKGRQRQRQGGAFGAGIRSESGGGGNSAAVMAQEGVADGAGGTAVAGAELAACGDGDGDGDSVDGGTCTLRTAVSVAEAFGANKPKSLHEQAAGPAASSSLQPSRQSSQQPLGLPLAQP